VVSSRFSALHCYAHYDRVSRGKAVTMADLLVPLATIATSAILSLIGASITWRTLQQQRREWNEEAERRAIETIKIQSEREKIESEISESVMRQVKAANDSLQEQLTSALAEIATLRATMAEREAYHERRYRELENRYKQEIASRDKIINSLQSRIRDLELKTDTGPLKEP